ncbi:MULTISPECIES: hypothetical protein [Prauserella salsuginis group]|uniref:Uncharacterized protein n=2 Tax=Prauserella salsuginis group TaxID=2893672 RepID=A0A839XSE1_9PSEU|nr:MULTISPECIES: hypothetical protein [Prauserella salsuginis group]MBB3662785.1 hypothetical protein [Prauserella sediminis]
MTRALGTAAATVVAAGLTALSAPAAAAETQTIVDSCTSTAAAPIGAKVVVDGAAVKGPVRTGAEEAKTQMLQATWPKKLAEEISKHKLEVGTVPNKATGAIGGEPIAAAVGEALDGHWALGVMPSTKERVLESIKNKVGGVCGMPVEATNYSKPTSSRPQSPNQGSNPQQGGGSSGEHQQQPSQPGGQQRGVPVTPDGPQGSGDAYAAPRDYSDIPEASAPTQGSAVPPDMRYSPQDGVPGAPDSPEYGVLSDGGIGEGGKTGGGDVRNAGNADALAADDAAPNQVQLPMLLAVVALAGVTAALVRTWVLRKAA